MAKKAIKGITFKAPEGHFISGIPRRNLSPEEWEALPEALREKALDSGLYKIQTTGSKAEPGESEGDQ